MHEEDVADLPGLPAWPRDLAYLSACLTTDVAGEVLDESVHPASAFQLLGFGHVVATAFPIPDNLAVAICRQFYDSLFTDALPGADPGAAYTSPSARHWPTIPLDPLAWGLGALRDAAAARLTSRSSPGAPFSGTIFGFSLNLATRGEH